jgi:tetratricopeptide (TPR) repeat protein
MGGNGYAPRVASDDESTQPIDIAGLRSSLTSSGSGPRPEREAEEAHEEAFADEHTAVGPPPVAALEEILDSDGPYGVVVHPASSITRVNVASVKAPQPLSPEEEAAVTVQPPTTTRMDITHSMPGTVPAHELVQALVAAMGARSDRLAQTAESDAGEGEGEGEATLLTMDDDDVVEDDDQAETGTRLPRPAPWSPDVEVTSVSGGDRPAAPASVREIMEPAGPSSRGVPATDPSSAPVTHPADWEDETRLGNLDRASVHAVFAAAEANEHAPVFDAQPDEPEEIEPEPDSEPNILDVDSMELESVADLDEAADLDKTGERDFFAPEHTPEPEPEPEPELPVDAGGELPRFSLASMDDIVLSANEADVQLVSRPVSSISIPSIPFSPTSFDDERVEDISADVEEVAYEEEEGGATLHRASTTPAGTAASAFVKKALPATRLSGSPGPMFQPPAPVGRAIVPAYEVDTDDDEEQLQKEGSFRALLDLYRLRLADAPTLLAKSALLHKIASVHEYRLGEPEEAFKLLVEAFDLRPGDDDIVASLDRVAREAGRVGELVERARKNLHTADVELKVILLGHLVYWYERVLGRGQELSPFVSELERLDKAHPVILRRGAQMAAANGDIKSQRELLVRALDRTARRDEKVQLHLALAGAHAGTPEATKHYESAVANDASSVVALQGLERIGREQAKHGQVEWCLERQVEVALTTAERIDALIKLADLHETKYLKRERAAEILERVVELEPSHPQALKGLERCYHALRDWPRLARVLRARADNAYDKKQKTELLELAAEVFESKLGDPASAVEVHRDLLVVDPKHRRALGDLARLYEKLGDWGNMATYKARVAELAPSKRQASQQLVQLGDFLSAPERDAIAARLQYERAVTVDPTNATAWEALQRVAAEAGDDRRVAQCLEQRAKSVDGPRQRAAIFVELANLYATNGDERAARTSFEKAVDADPTNESAAIAMLDAFSREEKWKEAAPLCELLVNAATRDKDTRTLFTRLRLSTRISAALADADRAMTSCLAALDLEPDDEGAQADLVAVCTQCRENPRVVMRAKDCLTRIASGPTVLPAGVLVGLAQLQRDAGEVDAAATTLEHALESEPDHPDVIRDLADVYLTQGDFPRCCKLMVDMARNATTADLRFQLLCETGEIWARRADELDKAATVFEEAREIKPLDHWLLHTLMWLYGERHRWDDLSNVLESIAQIQESPDRKAKSFFAMAQVVLEKVQDPRRAAELFDQVLDIDKTRLDAFEQLVRALTEVKDWEALELFYRKMIARIKDDTSPLLPSPATPANTNLQFALFQQLGLIYRDRLEDAARAYEALEFAARLRPDDAEVRKIVTELLVGTDNIENAVARVRELVARDPHNADLYAELYELFLRQHFFDKAWCAVNVLAQMRELSEEQRRFHEDYGPMPLAQVPGQIVEQAWRSHVLHADLDPTLTNVFSRMTPAVARMRYSQLRPDQLVYAAGRPFTPAHSRLYEAIRVTFANSAEILHMTPPDLLLGDPSSSVPFAPALAPFGAVHVGVPAVEARSESLIYVIGKRLAEQRPELIARAFFPAISDLAALLGAAVRVGRQERAKDAASAALDASLAANLTPPEREAIRGMVMHAAMEGGLVDVKRWSQAADLSSMRAGLLLAGDVGPARKTILAEPQSTADLPPREKVAELYKFATSDLYYDLRGAIGVAVQA